MGWIHGIISFWCIYIYIIFIFEISLSGLGWGKLNDKPSTSRKQGLWSTGYTVNNGIPIAMGMMPMMYWVYHITPKSPMHYHLWPSFPLTWIFWGYIPHFWTSPKSLFSGMSWCTDWNCFAKNLSGLHVDASKCTGASVPETGGTYLAGCSCEKGGVRGESWPILASKF